MTGTIAELFGLDIGLVLTAGGLVALAVQLPGGSSIPPPSDGAKVVISDTDHFAPGMGDALWALEVLPTRPQPRS